MDKDTEKFIAEGMKRYKQASYVLVKFGQEIESQLKDILNARKEWGKFKPKEQGVARSTRFWSAYPLLNAKLDGKLKDHDIQRDIHITIAVNWYQAEGDYPFYCVWIEPNDFILDKMVEYGWNSAFEFKENALRFIPDPKDFDLTRDYVPADLLEVTRPGRPSSLRFDVTGPPSLGSFGLSFRNEVKTGVTM